MRHNWTHRNKKKGERCLTLQSGNISYYKGREGESLNGVDFLVSKKHAHKAE